MYSGLKHTYVWLGFFNILFIYIVCFESEITAEGRLQLIISFLIHSIAFFSSLKFFNKFKIVYVSLLSFFNLISLAIAPTFVNFVDFQLGVFNVAALEICNIAFTVFYALHFYIIKHQNPIRFNTTRGKINISQLQFIFLILYASQVFYRIEISGFIEMVQFYTLGVFLFGFIHSKNNIIQNLMLLILVLHQTFLAVTSGLIYQLIYLFSFLIFSLYIFKGFSRRGVYSILTLSVFVIVFSILFSPVKLTYRTMDLANFSLIEKSKVIFNLISENNSKDLQDREDEKSTLWRLTYSLSAISLVIEKTPNTVPFWNGQSYVNILYKFIPRIIWNEKPKEDMGQQFGHKYSILADENLTTSMNTPIIAEAYMNFGFFFIFIVVILMAILMAKMFSQSNVLNKHNSGSTVESLFNDINIAIASIFFLQWESNFTMLLRKLIILFIFTKLTMWINFRKQTT